MSYKKLPLQGFAICIDPGHGGKDPGAVDGKNPVEKDVLYTEEEDINLVVGLLLQRKLQSLGARVTITRAGDTYPSLTQRYTMANKFLANIFISIHCNSATPKAVGIETLAHSRSTQGQRLARLVQEELIKAAKQPSRGVKLRDDLAVLNGAKMPTILVELGFVSNPGEEVKLNNPGYQELLADAITKGVLRYRKGE